MRHLWAVALVVAFSVAIVGCETSGGAAATTPAPGDTPNPAGISMKKCTGCNMDVPAGPTSSWCDSCKMCMSCDKRHGMMECKACHTKMAAKDMCSTCMMCKKCDTNCTMPCKGCKGEMKMKDMCPDCGACMKCCTCPKKK